MISYRPFCQCPNPYLSSQTTTKIHPPANGTKSFLGLLPWRSSSCFVASHPRAPLVANVARPSPMAPSPGAPRPRWRAAGCTPGSAPRRSARGRAGSQTAPQKGSSRRCWAWPARAVSVSLLLLFLPFWLGGARPRSFSCFGACRASPRTPPDGQRPKVCLVLG